MSPTDVTPVLVGKANKTFEGQKQRRYQNTSFPLASAQDAVLRRWIALFLFLLFSGAFVPSPLLTSMHGLLVRSRKAQSCPLILLAPP